MSFSLRPFLNFFSSWFPVVDRVLPQGLKLFILLFSDSFLCLTRIFFFFFFCNWSIGEIFILDRSGKCEALWIWPMSFLLFVMLVRWDQKWRDTWIKKQSEQVVQMCGNLLFFHVHFENETIYHYKAQSTRNIVFFFIFNFY